MYDLDESGNCYKVRLLAAQLGVTLELIPLDESDREPQLGELNAVLEVPTLVL
jgi:glutathione S-transferase